MSTNNLATVIRYSIPNAVTAGSLLLGVAAIVTAQAGDLMLAGWMIVWCVLLDVLDGAAARLMKASSAFGAQFDSFADNVAFGIAPAVLVFTTIVGPGVSFAASGEAVFVGLCCAIYALAAAIRLARFNVVDPPKRGFFVGIPTTVCGAFVTTATLVHLELGPATIATYNSVMPFVVAVLGCSMISKFWFPKPSRFANPVVNLVHIVNTAIIYVCGVLQVWPWYLFGASIFFVVTGVLIGVRGKADHYAAANSMS